MYELWNFDYAGNGEHRLMDITASADVAESWSMSASANIAKRISEQDWQLLDPDGIFE